MKIGLPLLSSILMTIARRRESHQNRARIRILIQCQKFVSTLDRLFVVESLKVFEFFWVRCLSKGSFEFINFEQISASHGLKVSVGCG